MKGDVVSGLGPPERVRITPVALFGTNTLVEEIGFESCQIVARPPVTRTLQFSSEFAVSRTCSQLRRYSFCSVSEQKASAKYISSLYSSRSTPALLPYFLAKSNQSIATCCPCREPAILPADDTGGDKTIVTGIIVNDLLFRVVLQKILVIMARGLTKQWRDEELQEKFGLDVWLVNRAIFEAEPDDFGRYEQGIIATSIHFLPRNQGYLKATSEPSVDLVVVDEAHTQIFCLIALKVCAAYEEFGQVIAGAWESRVSLHDLPTS